MSGTGLGRSGDILFFNYYCNYHLMTSRPCCSKFKYPNASNRGFVAGPACIQRMWFFASFDRWGRSASSSEVRMRRTSLFMFEKGATRCTLNSNSFEPLLSVF